MVYNDRNFSLLVLEAGRLESRYEQGNILSMAPGKNQSFLTSPSFCGPRCASVYGSLAPICASSPHVHLLSVSVFSPFLIGTSVIRFRVNPEPGLSNLTSPLITSAKTLFLNNIHV